MNNKKLFQFLKSKYSVLFILFICIIFWLSIFYWNKATFTGIKSTNVKLSAPNNPNEKHEIDNYYPTEITLGPKASNFKNDKLKIIKYSYNHTWGKDGATFQNEFQLDRYFIKHNYGYLADVNYTNMLQHILSQELISTPKLLQYVNMNPIYQIKNPALYYKKYNALASRIQDGAGDSDEDSPFPEDNHITINQKEFKKGYLFSTPELIDHYNTSIPAFINPEFAPINGYDLSYTNSYSYLYQFHIYWLWIKYHTTPWQRIEYENAVKQLKNKDIKYTNLANVYHNGVIIDGYDCFNHMQKVIRNDHPAYKIYNNYISNIYAHYSSIIPQGLWMYNKTHYPKLPVKTRIADGANDVAWTYNDSLTMTYYRTNLNHWLPATYIAKLDTHPAIFVKKNCKSLKSKDINQGYLYYGTDLQKGSGKYQVNINGKIYHNQYKTIKGTDYIPTIDPINNKIDDWIPINAIGQIYGRPIQRN